MLENVRRHTIVSRHLLDRAIEDSPIHDRFSFSVQFAAVPTNLITTVENFLVQAALAQGWTVTVPDYQGPNSAFIAGQLEGRAVLDGIRATLKYPKLNLNKPKIAVWVSRPKFRPARIGRG